MIPFVMTKPRLAFVLSLFGLIFSFTHVAGQNDSLSLSEEYYKLGMEVFDFSHRKQATELFVLSTRMNPKSAKAQFMAGQSIMLTIRKEQSLPYFLRAWKLDPKVNEDILFFLAKAYHYSEKFDSAIQFYDRYNRILARSMDLNKSKKIDQVDRKIFECRNAMIYMTKPVDVVIAPLNSNINSEYPDYAPTITENETEMVFTTRRPEENLNVKVAVDHEYYEDIFYSQKINGEWQPARNIGAPLNTNFHNASVNLSPDGTEMILYHDSNGGDLLISARDQSRAWSAPMPLEGINTQYLENSASITDDDKLIYFTSNRPGGYGGTDIYSCELGKNGRWVNLKNLGPKVNTDMDEDGVFISANGKHLYFSSNGHAGMGDLDIYRSSYDPVTSTWSDPINMGYPINSVENDIYFVLNAGETFAYISSVRNENVGEQDIYKIDMTNWKPVDLSHLDIIEDFKDPLKPIQPANLVQPFKMNLVVVDHVSNEFLNATISFNSIKGDSLQVQNPSKGRFEISLTSALGSNTGYKFSANSKGYATFSSAVYFHGLVSNVQDTIRLEKIVVNLPYPLNIYFGHDSDQPISTEGIQDRLIMLVNNPSMRVEIGGHTDNLGAKEFNKILSQRRATAVKNYLVKSGIDASRVTAIGYGDSKPVGTNLTREGRRMNRRTEFKILEQ
jgi:outer membrane protein OmpA-like peptidoglycan-associated protein